MKNIFLPALAAMALAACSGDNEPGPTEPPVADPAGTVTVNFDAFENDFKEKIVFSAPWSGDYCPMPDSPYTTEDPNANLGWANSDGKIGIGWIQGSFWGEYGDYIYWYDAFFDMVDVGRVASLGNIDELPSSSWGDAGEYASVDCKEGHGYVVRIAVKSRVKYPEDGSEEDYFFTGSEEDFWEGEQYIRIFVEKVKSSGRDGAYAVRLKYQYPFEL